MKFHIIAAVDDNFGLGFNSYIEGQYISGSVPWYNSTDLKSFRNHTLNSTIIMGRHTWASLPKKLDRRRHVIVTSQSLESIQAMHDNSQDVITAPTLAAALMLSVNDERVFVIGGAQLYLEALTTCRHMCDKVYINHIRGTYQCNVFFPIDKLLELPHIKSVIGETTEINSLYYTLVPQHGEFQYLNLMEQIMKHGDTRMDRTKTGIRSVFGTRMEFDMRQGFPLLTTKQTWFTGIKKELLFFLSGKTDTKILEAQGVNIWKGNTSKEFLTKSGLPWREGDMGPGYSHQWRHAGAPYYGCDVDYSGCGVDQIAELVDGIKNDPYGRRHIIDAWSVPDIKDMALPPCHCFVQFYVGNDENGNPTYLDCLLHQRSADMFLGVPFNIASYSMLLHLVAHVTGLTARKFIHSLGDAHIYSTHFEAVNQQLQRGPFEFPTLKISDTVTDITSCSESDIKLLNYKSWGKITAVMAV